VNTTLTMPKKETVEKVQFFYDHSWKGLYSVSGVLLIITAVIWTIVTWTARSLYSSGYPGDPASYLQLISQHQQLALNRKALSLTRS
jgi:hypothetical protein